MNSTKKKKKIAIGIALGLLLTLSFFVWIIFLVGGPVQVEKADSDKFLKTADQQYYYVKETSWQKTFFIGGIILPSQVHLYESKTEIPVSVDIIWPDLGNFNNINQNIVTFSLPDNDDPGKNGLDYSLIWAWKPGQFPLFVSLILIVSIINFLAVYFWKKIPSKYFLDNPTQLDIQKNFITAALIFVINLVLLSIVFTLIGIFVKNHLDLSAIDSQIWPAFRFKPEQVERTQYMSGIIIFPIISIIAWYFIRKLKFISDRSISILFPTISLEVVLGIGVVLFFAVRQNSYFYTQGIPLFQFPWMAVYIFIFFLVILFIEHRYPTIWTHLFLTGGIILSEVVVLIFVFFSTFMTEYDPFMHATTPHFSAYMYSIDQVFKGKTILIDLQTQYGFYAYFLEPLFKWVGMGIFQIETVYSILQILFFLTILFLVSRLVKNRLILLCAIWIIPGTWLWEMNNFGNYENIYQYFPHRIIFPGLILLMIWLYQKTHNRIRLAIYISTFILGAVGVLWNFETGFISLLCWMIFLIWDALNQFHALGSKKTTLNGGLALLNTLVVLVLALGILYFYTYFRSGQFPDLNNYFYYQSIFYGSGFFMLPMPATFHMWNLVLLTYAIGLYIGISRLGTRLFQKRLNIDSTKIIRENMIFIISIMGFGLFSYYQGRSHDANLLATSWTFWFLIILYADELFQHLFESLQNSPTPSNLTTKIGLGFLTLLTSFVIVSYTAGIISITPGLTKRVEVNLSNIIQLNKGISSEHDLDIKLINKYAKPDDDILILSNYDQAYLYIQSGTINPLPVPSFGEFFAKTDYQKVSDYLSDNQKDMVIMTKNFNEDFPGLFQQVKQQYTPLDQTKYLTVYIPKTVK